METTRRKLFGLAAFAPLASALMLGQEKSTATSMNSAVAPVLVPKMIPELAPGVTSSAFANHRPSLSPREQAHQRYFPDVTLLTHEGKKVNFYSDLIKGKVVTLNFMFADCQEICPLVTANLEKVQKLLGGRVGKDIFMYSFSLQGQDSPEKLRAYRKAYNIKPGWTFLTGDLNTMELLRRKLGFTYPDPKTDADKTQHIGNFRFGSEPLIMWETMPGMAEPRYLVEMISYVEAEHQGHPKGAREIFHSADPGKG
ncbi:MAG TPA: SCO family protein [Candidatus Angelobacter sp.]|nr:SCO family protein [Candidatus Angelobacter sp.]